MAGDVLRLLAADLLATAEDALTAASWPADPYAGRITAPPDRVFAHAGGEPAWDCEQLAVWFDGVRTVGLSQPTEAGPMRGQPVMLQAVVHVHVLREIAALDGDGLPSVAEMQADADRLFAEGDALLTLMLRRWHDGSLLPTAPIGCGAVSWRPGLESIGPQGGYAGWRLSADVTL